MAPMNSSNMSDLDSSRMHSHSGESPLQGLKRLLSEGDSRFWEVMGEATNRAGNFTDLVTLSAIRRKAKTMPGAPLRSTATPLRIAFIGGCNLYPLHELTVHYLEANAFEVEFWVGDFDNYVAEILDVTSGLHRFAPEFTFLFPNQQRCAHQLPITAGRQETESAALALVADLLGLAERLNEISGSEIILANFFLPNAFDPGEIRTRTLTSDWSFRKLVNLELGLAVPAFVHLCDVELIGLRAGGIASQDRRSWFATKQPASPDTTVQIARETAAIVCDLRRPAKKVLVLDLDNTIWGGVIGDDGLDGIVLGDTNGTGEAYKAFQRHLRSLRERGVLLAVCSKNDHEKALEPFLKHPEMVLRESDLVAFKANWNPKSDNLREIAVELNLGLNSFVFVDDNPAEIEIVRQFTPEVTAIHLGEDPSLFVEILQEARVFSTMSVTEEDRNRTTHYQIEKNLRSRLESVTDMDSYLESLEMEASFSGFTETDIPRIAQLIGRSNQFNLTTRRHSEAAVARFSSSPEFITLTVRLRDRFVDHGLVAVLIGELDGESLVVETWLMSCRVLNRRVEHLCLNELARLAGSRNLVCIRGTYLPTEKNALVKDHYDKLGFTALGSDQEGFAYTLSVTDFKPRTSPIQIAQHAR
jgi:FkbH-like protein